MEITSEFSSCSNAVKTHNVSYIQKKLANGLPIVKALIKYNCNSLEENCEEENEPIDIEFTKQKSSWNDENAIDFKWSDVKEEDEKDIALVNFIECLQKLADEDIFSQKSNWMIVWWLRYHT